MAESILRDKSKEFAKQIVFLCRDIVFSADLCYNRFSKKPPSEREVARRSRDGRSLRDFLVVLS